MERGRVKPRSFRGVCWTLRWRRRGCEAGVLGRLVKVMESTGAEIVLENDLRGVGSVGKIAKWT